MFGYLVYIYLIFYGFVLFFVCGLLKMRVIFNVSKRKYKYNQIKVEWLNELIYN